KMRMRSDEIDQPLNLGRDRRQMCECLVHLWRTRTCSASFAHPRRKRAELAEHRVYRGEAMEASGCDQLIFLPSRSRWRRLPRFRCRRVPNGSAEKTASDRCAARTACTATATLLSAEECVTAT